MSPAMGNRNVPFAPARDPFRRGESARDRPLGIPASRQFLEGFQPRPGDPPHPAPPHTVIGPPPTRVRNDGHPGRDRRARALARCAGRSDHGLGARQPGSGVGGAGRRRVHRHRRRRRIRPGAASRRLDRELGRQYLRRGNRRPEGRRLRSDFNHGRHGSARKTGQGRVSLPCHSVPSVVIFSIPDREPQTGGAVATKPWNTPLASE
jgi:hypothetical protein